MSSGRQPVAVRGVVRGRVQGVGFRDTTELTARGLGLSGWVRNLDDGSVALHAEGPERELDQLVAFLKVGPPAARVDGLELEPAVVEGFEHFAVRGIGSGSFVVQEHLATRRHFDLRLEVGGVMRSWAVPAGPSLDPAIRREAIEVADHTRLDAGFEGAIPNGGVIIWDRGSYERTGLVPWPEALDRGVAEFLLNGEKLRGAFTLSRKAGRGMRSRWSLAKAPDEQARPGSDVVADQPRSVVSGRTLDELLETP
ncbi:MAG: acylphosphatase [Solirubrobacterales bacterium]|nr:acylphosphatase [Solirubrobacterales bacterium]